MKLYDKNDLKDSRIFFDKNPPKYMTILIFFIAFCILGTFVSSFYISKPYIIKASGVATTTDNNYVSVEVSGQITRIFKNEGDIVKEGDILFNITDGRDNAQRQAIQSQIDLLKEKVTAITLYEKSLDDKHNYLKNSGIQQTYYGKVELYLTTNSTENHNNDSEVKYLNDLKRNLDVLEKEKESLENKYDSEIDENKKSDILSKINVKISEIDTLKNNINQLTVQSTTPSSQATQLYQQLIAELGEERNTVNFQITQLEGQLKQINEESQLKEIKAKNSGYIHYLAPIKVGISLQSYQTIAEISHNNPKNFIVEAKILAKDISKIKVGQNVNIELHGVNIQKFGTIEGNVMSISSGTTIEETTQGNLIYYQCKISLKSTTLKSSKGETISIVKSMPVQAKIIYDKETYFDWFCETINLKT